MTALKPIENRRVRAVASERYPLNKKCAHPECNEDAVDPHHAFPRSYIAGDSWFVEIAERPEAFELGSVVVPHVTGLCRPHHDAVELHEAWIKLEDGEWRWYDRVPAYADNLVAEGMTDEWILLGPLNPQPGSVEGKPKRKRFKGEARRSRTTISIKVPADDQEDGGAVWDELFGDGKEDRPYGRVRERMAAEGLDPDTTMYVLIVNMANDWLNS
jgi:hypothetical protein